MTKKFSKRTSSIRTVSLALGSISLIVIAFSQITNRDVCTSNLNSIDKQFTLS